MKLIQQSVAHLSRGRLGERDWVEGRIMLGHRTSPTSGIHALFDAGYLSEALRVTEEIVDGIEAPCPGTLGPAFSPRGTSGQEVSPD